MAIRMRLDTLAETASLERDGGAAEAEGPRLRLVTGGEELARLLDGARACNFSHEETERAQEAGVVDGFLRDCVEFCDVTDLPEPLRVEMEEYFSQRLDALWRQDWLVFGGAQEMLLDAAEPPLVGRAVTLCVARADSPSVRMDTRLRRSLERFQAAMARVRDDPDDLGPAGPGGGDDEGSGGGLLH